MASRHDSRNGSPVGCTSCISSSRSPAPCSKASSCRSLAPPPTSCSPCSSIAWSGRSIAASRSCSCRSRRSAASSRASGWSGPIATSRRLALAFFALLVALGYLAARSGFIPRAIGVWLRLAGISWCVVVLIPLPFALAAGMQGFGGLSEVAFALWLLFGGDAKPRPSRGDSLGS